MENLSKHNSHFRLERIWGYKLKLTFRILLDRLIQWLVQLGEWRMYRISAARGIDQCWEDCPSSKLKAKKDKKLPLSK